MKTNELTRHDWIAFAKGGGNWGGVGWLNAVAWYRVVRVATGAGWFIVPAAHSHSFTCPPSLLIQGDPSFFNCSPSAFSILPSISLLEESHHTSQIRAGKRRIAVGWSEASMPKMSQPCGFCIPLPPYGQENKEEIHKLRRIMKRESWRLKEEHRVWGQEWIEQRGGGREKGAI